MQTSLFTFNLRSLPVILLILMTGAGTAWSQQYRSENLFYLGGSPESLQSFKQHADEISIVCPAAYGIDSNGVIAGDVDRRVLEIAKEKGVKVMPLFASFDQKGIHQLLNDPAAKAEAIRLMLFYARQNHYYGWQLDLENVNFRDRDAYTAFFRQAADSLHQYGFAISMAIVKFDQPAPDAGNTDYQRYIYENWTGAFDVPAIAAAGDFISFMTYDQHIALTPPGPVAGMPWFKGMLQYLLNAGVPPEKISIGIPSYSDYWFPTGDIHMGARSTRDEIGYANVKDLLDRYHAVPEWMEDQQVYYTRWEEGGVFNWLFIEDARSFAAKYAIAKQHRLRGISVWILGAEDPGIWNVLKESRKPVAEARH